VALGSQVIGVFEGLSSDEYRSYLLVRVSKDTPDKPGYVERIEYVPFNAKTGKKLIPDNIKSGDLVCVGLYLDAQKFTRNGELKLFVTKRARYVELFSAAVWSL